MNKIELMIIVLWVCFCIYCVLPHDKLPPILLPKGAQHNTIGELPIVEMADDGVFAEKDGEEYSRKRHCISAVSSSCDFFDNKSLKQVRKIKKEYQSCIKRPDKTFNEYGEPIYNFCGDKPPAFENKEDCLEGAKKACGDDGRPRCSGLEDFGLGMFTCWGSFQ